MSRGLKIACGVCVLFTTLAFGHITVHNTQHMLQNHEGGAFIVGHSIVALVVGLLSLAGGISLLTGSGPKAGGA
jgi:delta 1-pyrroline-5-carboxylate dehydrogenase